MQAAADRFIELDATIHSSANVADLPDVCFNDVVHFCNADDVDTYLAEGNDLAGLVQDLVELGTRKAAFDAANTLADRRNAEIKLTTVINRLSKQGRSLSKSATAHFTDDCRERMAS